MQKFRPRNREVVVAVSNTSNRQSETIKECVAEGKKVWDRKPRDGTGERR